MARALSIENIINYNPVTLDFEGRWLASFGKPELCGSWLVWGASGHGKTRFVLQLCKYLCRFGRVAYDTLEEGLSKSMQNAILDVGMKDTARRFVLLDKENIADLIERLQRRKSPDIIVIDSVQYTGMTYNDYKKLRDEFPRKLFILISHADGKEPAGRVAKSIRYDAFVKIRIVGYKAFPISRYGGGEAYTIWEKGATDYGW